ncbi:MAG: hypothetical protein QGI75_02480 [Phycisphaerales bacterium]|jgi:hypothetical protein|nr:hypothetical protein [Phycisphaerales bacterium]
MSQSPTAFTMAAPTRFLPVLAEVLTSDIDPDRFADRLGTTINHPAFVLGHCAYYTGVCVTMLGGECNFDEEEASLYAMGAECLDEADRYPTKDACIARFSERCVFAAGFLESCDPEVLERSAAGTPFEERFSTLGQVAAFMLMGHPSFHLGQISAWRRVAGMNSAT